MQPRLTITLNGDLLERFNMYAEITNKTVKEAAKEALEDWMDTVGEGRVELITGVAIDSEAERMGLPVKAAPSGSCVPCVSLLH